MFVATLGKLSSFTKDHIKIYRAVSQKNDLIVTDLAEPTKRPRFAEAGGYPPEVLLSSFVCLRSTLF